MGFVLIIMANEEHGQVVEAVTSPGGLTMLDAAALVTGGAVASVHFRPFEEEIGGLTPLGFSFLVLAFAWLAVTAAGPFVYLVRRYGRRRPGYPSPPDLLWLAFGLPWAIAALYRSIAESMSTAANILYGNALFIGLALASGLAVFRLKRAWSALDAARTSKAPRRTWTEWIGTAIAVAWPLQLGLGFVVTK
jgi:hypothetical protein